MDVEDFATSPAKRRRTMSPEITTGLPNQNDTNSNESAQTSMMQTSPLANPPTMQQAPPIPGLGLSDPEATSDINPASEIPVDENGILDALMQHVESESRPEVLGQSKKENPQNEENRDAVPTMVTETPLPDPQIVEVKQQGLPASTEGDHHTAAMEAHITESRLSPAVGANINQEASETARSLTVDGVAEQNSTSTMRTSEMLDVIPTTIETAREDGDQAAEWEIDSSPLNSSSDSDSDSSDISSSEGSDDDADADYAMLDPEEQARILMQGDGGSDDEGGKSKDKGDVGPLRTANEKLEEVIPKPNIVVTEEMAIEELGKVESVVENTVLVKAKVSGEYQVLESGSLLCLKDRSVIGVVGETLGRVEQPLYTVRFTNDKAIEEAGLDGTSSIVYYVPLHSTFVFTRPLRAVKGSDASNFHDEEVGDDEMEFSDDEAEAEHKRKLKLMRQGRREDGSGRARGGRGGRGGHSNRGDRQFVSNSNHGGQNDAAYGNGSLEMNYDDMDSMEDGYTPLVRPSNLQEMAGLSNSVEPQSPESARRNFEQQRGRARGRGGQRGDRGRGGRGGRGRGRGNWDRSGNGSDRRQPYANDFNNPSTHQSSSTPFTTSQMGPPQNAYQYQQQQPHQPVLTPQNSSYPNFPFSPSPISPLPNQQFNLGGYGQQQQQFGNGAARYQHQRVPQVPPPGSHINPMFMQNFNQAAAAEVQRQLEQMRQNGGR